MVCVACREEVTVVFDTWDDGEVVGVWSYTGTERTNYVCPATGGDHELTAILGEN